MSQQSPHLSPEQQGHRWSKIALVILTLLVWLVLLGTPVI